MFVVRVTSLLFVVTAKVPINYVLESSTLAFWNCMWASSLAALFLFLTGKWWLVFFSQPPCTLAFFHILVVQCQYVVVTTFVHTILCCHIDMAHVIDLIYCPLLISFLPPLWLLLSENSLFDLMKLIMSGDIDSTFKRLEEWYPQVIKVFPLFFSCIDLICHLNVVKIL